MNTGDNIADFLLVITDGFDGDLTALQDASASVAAAGITALGIAYDETPGILVSISQVMGFSSTNIWACQKHARLKNIQHLSINYINNKKYNLYFTHFSSSPFSLPHLPLS